MLVIDDDLIFCELLVFDLRFKGVKVILVFVFEDVREVFKKYYFDLVILDNYLLDG